MSKSIVGVTAPKKQNQITESAAAKLLTNLFFSRIGTRFHCGTHYLGWSPEFREPRHWQLAWEEHMNRFNPVGDHLAGRFRGLVKKKALWAPVIVDLDRHNVDSDPDAFIKYVFKILHWLQLHFPKVNWSVVEVNPKNGSCKIWGFKGNNLFSMKEAKSIAQEIKDEFDVEVYPVNPQMMLPMRKDKITVVSTGILKRSQKYRMIESQYEKKKYREYFRTYSAVDFLDNINSRQPLDEKALLRALKWSTKKTVGQLKPREIEDEQFKSIYQRVDCKTEMEKFWDFDFAQPRSEFYEARGTILSNLAWNPNHLEVISNAARSYLDRKPKCADIGSSLVVQSGSSSTALRSDTQACLIERSFEYSDFSSTQHQLFRSEWEKGCEDAFKRDGLLVKAVFRAIGGRPSEDLVLAVKECLELFDGVYDEERARNRVCWWITYSAKTFVKPEAKPNNTEERKAKYLDEARRIVRQDMWYEEKRWKDNGFDEKGMPLSGWKIVRKIAPVQKAREIVAGVLDCVDFAKVDNQGAVSCNFIKKTMKACYGWFNWNIFIAVRDLLEQLGIVVIDKIHSTGKCWTWFRKTKRKGCSEYSFPKVMAYRDNHLISLVTLGVANNGIGLPNEGNCHHRDPSPPD